MEVSQGVGPMDGTWKGLTGRAIAAGGCLAPSPCPRALASPPHLPHPCASALLPPAHPPLRVPAVGLFVLGTASAIMSGSRIPINQLNALGGQFDALQQHIRQREPLVGSRVTIASPDVADILSRVGFDFLGIENERGRWTSWRPRS